MLTPTPPPISGFGLILEDLPATARWLQQAVQRTYPHLHMQVCATVASALAHIDDRNSQSQRIDLALIDLALPDGSGLTVLRHLTRCQPDATTVVTTIYDDDAHVFEALACGARGYLLKDSDGNVMVEYLRRIERGEPPLSPSVAQRLLQHFHSPSHLPAASETAPTASAPCVETAVHASAKLSKREEETLRLIALGMTVAESAQQLGLSAQTVAGYVKAIYQKLHISSRAQAAQEAIRRGIV